MMTKLLVILGITGNQGGSVAEFFLKTTTWKIRGISRNEKSEASLAWARKGVQIAQADFNDPTTLNEIFTGATAIFANTNFWEPFYNRAVQSILSPGQSINEYCYDKEVQQLKNIADVAAKVHGLERLIMSGLCDATNWSKGKYKGVYHFDSKAKGIEYLKETYPKLDKKMTVIHMGSYLSNWKRNLRFRKDTSGAICLVILKGTQNTLRPQLDITRDTGALVHAALNAAPGKAIIGCGVNLSWTEQLKTWCEMMGLQCGGFDELSLEDYSKLVPVPGLGRELGEMMLFENEFGFTGGEENVVYPEDLGILCPLTSWEEYIKLEDWTDVLAKLK